MIEDSGQLTIDDALDDPPPDTTWPPDLYFEVQHVRGDRAKVRFVRLEKQFIIGEWSLHGIVKFRKLLGKGVRKIVSWHITRDEMKRLRKAVHDWQEQHPQTPTT